MLLTSLALAADPVSLSTKGLSFSDATAQNTLNLGLSFQPRVTATFSGDPAASDDDALSDVGFRIRRMLFTANGTVAGRVDYRFRINAANALSFPDADGKTQLAAKPILDDAQVVFRVADPVQIAIGQWKVPFTATQMTSDTALLFPERSIAVDGYKFGDLKLDGFSWSRDAGAALLGTVAGKRLEYAAGVFNGDGTNVWPGDDGLLAVARVQVAPLGELKYDEVDLARGPARLAIAAAGSMNTHPVYSDAGDATDPQQIVRLGGELRVSGAGLNLQAEGMYGLTLQGDLDPTRSLGAYAQLGYCLPFGVAPGVRLSRLDPSLDAEDDGVNQVEGVINWYVPDPTSPGHTLGHKGQLQLAWATSLADGAEDPLSHQLQLAVTVGL